MRLAIITLTAAAIVRIVASAPVRILRKVYYRAKTAPAPRNGRTRGFKERQPRGALRGYAPGTGDASKEASKEGVSPGASGYAPGSNKPDFWRRYNGPSNYAPNHDNGPRRFHPRWVFFLAVYHTCRHRLAFHLLKKGSGRTLATRLLLKWFNANQRFLVLFSPDKRAAKGRIRSHFRRWEKSWPGAA